MKYIASNWYWIVADSTTQVYSSASKTYVSVTDATYVAWLATGCVATKIDADGMLLLQIDFLESLQTARMYRESSAGATNVFPTGTPFSGLTSAQALASIQTQISALRAQLT